LTWLVGPYSEPATYRAIAYLLLGLPMGIISFVLVVTGLSVGFGLLVTLLGIPVLVATLLVVRTMAGFERQLASSLLDAPMPRFVRGPGEYGGFWWRRVRELLTDRRTYAEIGFLLLRLPLGIADFVFVVTIMATALAALIQPILVTAGVPVEFGGWTVDTYAETLVFVPISIVYLLAGPRLLLAWSSISRRVATKMLGELGTSQLKSAIGEVLARSGRADAFTIFDELVLRLGRGPFLSITRVEAALLALVAVGRVDASREGSRIQYALA
jgi:hypothetical protein